MNIKVSKTNPINLELSQCQFSAFNYNEKIGTVLHFTLSRQEAMILRNQLSSALATTKPKKIEATNFVAQSEAAQRRWSPYQQTVEQDENEEIDRYFSGRFEAL